jgi:hypothetical protein
MWLVSVVWLVGVVWWVSGVGGVAGRPWSYGGHWNAPKLHDAPCTPVRFPKECKRDAVRVWLVGDVGARYWQGVFAA